MPKELNTHNIILSRFFRKNLKTIKSRNQTEDLEKSPYFCGILKEKQTTEEHKKPNRKKIGPQFKGFSNEDRERSKTDKERIELLVSKIEDNIKEQNIFLGFSQEEINQSNQLYQKNGEALKNLKNSTCQVFKGFSKQELNESMSKLSDILGMCEAIRNGIYKNIDRRILTNHLKEDKSREKLVCSKYWPKPEKWIETLEDVKSPKKNLIRFLDFNSFKIGRSLRKKHCVKIEKIKTEKQENDLILEIHKLHKELKAIQKSKFPPIKDIKPQDTPFIQIKKELIMPSFIPPKSPHSLIEEDLYHDPWALLISTIFLNKTSGRTARPYVFWFLDENPDPLVVLGKRVEQLETYFGALGLQKTRATQVWKMSHDFIYKNWQKVSELYGIGRYGEDAFRMFCLGDFSIEPQDRYLRIYKSWYEMQDRKSRIKEMNS